MKQSFSYHVELPEWTQDLIFSLDSHFPTLESRMDLVIRCSRHNFEQDTGGPFAAGIFESKTGKLVALGVNRVVPHGNSTLHAEIVAIALAQATLKNFDLGAPDLPHHQLVVNGRPCAMCFGSIPWSGVRSLAIGASGAQIESITGFDEGPIHPNWQSELYERGIEVIEGVNAEAACDVFRDFAATNPIIYNGRGGQSSTD